MATDWQRLTELESKIRLLEEDMPKLAALPIKVMVAIVDQMVEDGAMSAETRIDIVDRMQDQLPKWPERDDKFAHAAVSALPKYSRKAAGIASTPKVDRERKQQLGAKPIGLAARTKPLDLGAAEEA